MERFPSSPSSPGSSNKKFKFSQFDVQRLIEQEVRSATEKNEAKLKGLIETIEHLDCDIDYENSIQKLEGRINTVSQRAKAALAQMAKRKTKALTCLSSDPEDISLETTPQRSSLARDKSGEERMQMDEEIFQIMETTKRALKRMHDDKLALTAAAADLGEERRPPAPAPHLKVGPSGMEKGISKEEAENWPKPETPPGGMPPPQRTGLKCSGQSEQPYPPLPSAPFPSVLPFEAASYSIPPKPSVRLALVRKPARLSVLWNVVEEDPSAPPMDNYTIYMSVETRRGSGLFSGWTRVGLVQDRPLPICVMISKSKPGHKVGVAVVGKDKFGRYGPYSDVATANIPD